MINKNKLTQIFIISAQLALIVKWGEFGPEVYALTPKAFFDLIAACRVSINKRRSKKGKKNDWKVKIECMDINGNYMPPTSLGRAVYRVLNGEIPVGMDVHHILGIFINLLNELALAEHNSSHPPVEHAEVLPYLVKKDVVTAAEIEACLIPNLNTLRQHNSTAWCIEVAGVNLCKQLLTDIDEWEDRIITKG